MNKFDKYIQGRILKAYNNAPGIGRHDYFDGFSRMFCMDSIDRITDYMLRYGCGKQRAKDYAHYIVAWLEEQNEPAIEKSNLTDEDAEHIKNLVVEVINAYSMQHQDDAVTNLVAFINSLKG